MKKTPTKKTKRRDGFTESDKHVLNGIKLYPWTPARSIAAQSCGMLYPEIGKAGWEQYRRTKLYPGAVKDTIIALYLCTLDEDAVDQADSAPVEAYRQARQWAAKLRIHDIKNDEFWQAYAKFSEIMTEVDKSITTPRVEPGEEADEGNE